MNKYKYSKNNKLNKVLTEIEVDLLDNLELEEIERYYNTFGNEVDFNIVQYGNMLVYYNDIYNFYRSCGYKSTDKMSTSKIWELYKNQVGYVAKKLILEY